MKYLLLIVLLLLPIQVSAFSNFAWDEVTQNADGTLCIDLAGYELHCGNVTSGLYTILKDCGMITAVNGVCKYPINSVISTDGTYYCVASAYDTAGIVSGNSNEINFTVNAVAPKNPGNLRVTD
jgi:hypothetical protein